MTLEIGQEAPDFELPSTLGGAVRLSDYRGRSNVVLMFYPFAFTGVCTAELCALRDEQDTFTADGAQVLSVSCDPVHSLKAFAEQQGYAHPLLSDFWPHGAVSSAYGVFLADKGFATRGTFIIDREGILRWSVVNAPGEARSNDDYRAALADLA